MSDLYDVIVVGAGPGGTTHQAVDSGFKLFEMVIAYERGLSS